MGLKANEFYSGMRKVQKTTVKTQDSLRTLKRVAVVAFTGWGIKRLAGSFLEAAATAEGYQVRLTGLLGSVEEGNRLFEEMNQYAAQTPFEFEQIMGAATALSGVMRGGVKEISEWMPMIGDLAASTGLDIQTTTQQVIRMYSAGAASADLFRERGVLAMLGFQAGVSYTAEQTREIMQKSWTKMGSQWAGMTDKLRTTWAGSLSMFRDAWFQFRTKVMQSGPFQVMKQQAQELLKQFDKLKKEGKVDEWALSTAQAILTAFEYASYGVELFINSVKGVSLAFAGTMTAVTTGTLKILDWFQTIMEWQLKVAQWTGWDWMVEQTTQFLETIRDTREELEHNQAAGANMANALIDGILETNEKFGEFRDLLEELKEAQRELTETESDSNEERAEGFAALYTGYGETSQDFINEEMERQLALQMYEAGMLGKRAKKFKWFTDFQASYEKAKGKERLRANQEYFKLIAEALGKHGQAAFRAYQALSIAETVMSTVQAAQDAYAWGWKYGGPAAPVLSAVMAAIAIAAGMARVAQISSEKFEYAMGGWVHGGSGMRDDVLIGATGGTAHMATGGEFVVNREAAADNAGLLEAINAGETFGDVILPVTIELDGEILWTRIYKATRDGHLQIHKDALAER
jgi:hypothetical protein